MQAKKEREQMQTLREQHQQKMKALCDKQDAELKKFPHGGAIQTAQREATDAEAGSTRRGKALTRLFLTKERGCVPMTQVIRGAPPLLFSCCLFTVSSASGCAKAP